MTAQQSMLAIAGVVFFIGSVWLIGEMGGLTLPVSHDSPSTTEEPINTTPTYAMFPWSKAPNLLPVELAQGVGIGYDDTSIRVYAVVTDHRGEDLLLVEGHQTSTDGQKVTGTEIFGEVHSCSSGSLWIKWTEGAFEDKRSEASDRAQAACEANSL